MLVSYNPDYGDFPGQIYAVGCSPIFRGGNHSPSGFGQSGPMGDGHRGWERIRSTGARHTADVAALVVKCC